MSEPVAFADDGELAFVIGYVLGSAHGHAVAKGLSRRHGDMVATQILTQYVGTPPVGPLSRWIAASNRLNDRIAAERTKAP